MHINQISTTEKNASMRARARAKKRIWIAIKIDCFEKYLKACSSSSSGTVYQHHSISAMQFLQYTTHTSNRRENKMKWNYMWTIRSEGPLKSHTFFLSSLLHCFEYTEIKLFLFEMNFGAIPFALRHLSLSEFHFLYVRWKFRQI